MPKAFLESITGFSRYVSWSEWIIRWFRSRMRQMQGDTGAAVAGDQRHAAAVGLDDGARDRQPQPGALAVALTLTVDAVETLEQAGGALGRDVVAGIDDRQSHLVGIELDDDADLAVAPRVAQGVGQQVGDRAAQHQPVAGHAGSTGDADRHALLLCQRLVELG